MSLEEFNKITIANFKATIERNDTFDMTQNYKMIAGSNDDGSVWVQYMNQEELSYLNIDDAAKDIFREDGIRFGSSDIPCHTSFYLGDRFDDEYNEEDNTYEGNALNIDEDGDACWSEQIPNQAMVYFLELKRKEEMHRKIIESNTTKQNSIIAFPTRRF